MYKIYIRNEVVLRTKDKKKALKTLAKVFRATPHDDIYLYGGRIGSWQ